MPSIPPGATLPQRALDIWAMRADLRQAFDIRARRGRNELFWWYYLDGFREMGLAADPERDNVEALNQAYPRLRTHCGIAISWLMRALWIRHFPAEAGPRSPFGLRLRKTRLPESEEEQTALLQWYFTEGLASHNLTDFLTDAHVAALSNHPFLRVKKFPVPARSLQRFGVNIFGHARGRLGIGEDVRMAARGLETAGIPFVVRNVDPSTGIAPEDDSVSHLISDALPYSINLFCMSGIESAALLRREPDIREGRHNIGFWPWELPEWPVLWHHAYDMIDEIWAGSHFTRDAYLRSAPVPVSWQPMAVSASETDGRDRASFSLPENRFLFAFAFDGASSVARKNPVACLTAFQTAFPIASGDAVGLVIKALRAENDPTWQQLASAARADSRIHLVTESLPRGSLLDLYRAIDCFLSLHRSEGFGRNIAECMMLGKPVIATAHSGNLDFTTAATAALVPVRLRDLGDAEYPFGNRQRWAEPDVGVAAVLARRMYSDPVWREGLASRGRAFVTDRYEPSRAGAVWAGALRRIAPL